MPRSQTLTNEINRLNQDVNSLSQSTSSLSQTKEDLERRLKDQINSGDLAIQMQGRGLVVTIANNILFDSGKTEVRSSAASTLNTLGDEINKLEASQVVFVEGHTDNDPIKHSNFKSNWELSTTRATEVIHYLVSNVGVDPSQLAASGFGEYRPVASNDTRQGKAKNRRVEIIISPLNR